MHIKISSHKIVRMLTGGIVFLLLMHLAMQVVKFTFGNDDFFGLVLLFDMDEENNFPTLYSFFLFLTAAKLFGYIAYDSKILNKKFTWHWAGLSALFVGLALDEMFSLHERLNDFLAKYWDTGNLFYPWQIPYLIFMVGLGMFYFQFLKHFVQLRRRMFFAAGVYLLGVMVIEAISGWYYAAMGLGYDEDIIFMFLSTAEEILEMSGLVILIYGLMEFVRTEIKQITMEWE